MEQNPNILNALLPLQQDSNDAPSIVVSQGAKEPPVTCQPVSEAVVASQLIGIDQKVYESTDNQEDTEVMIGQHGNETTSTPVDSSSRDGQGSDEVIEIGVEQTVKEEVTDQDVNQSQEGNDVASIQEISDIATSQETNEAVNMQETVNTQEMANSQDTSDAQVVNHLEDVLPQTSIYQDLMPDDAINPPHHKTLLDLWQHSFVLTHPSCVDCSSEARALWHEPVMDKTPTHPLQHYTSSVHSDQVSSCHDVTCCCDDTSIGR